MTVEKRRDAFTVNKKLKMKQAQSLIELKNEQNKKFNELVTAQNSDAEVPYLSLLTNEYTLEHIFNNEGRYYLLFKWPENPQNDFNLMVFFYCSHYLRLWE